MFSRDICVVLNNPRAALATPLKSEDNASISFKGAPRDNAAQFFREKKIELWILTKALTPAGECFSSSLMPQRERLGGWCEASSERWVGEPQDVVSWKYRSQVFVTTVVSVASQIFKPSHVNKNRFLPYHQLGLKQKADVLCKHYFLN